MALKKQSNQHFSNYQEEKHYYEEVAPEQAYLAWYRQQERPKYAKPSVTVDFVALRFNGEHLQALLEKRKKNPFRNCWALPGSFLKENESIEQALEREVHDKLNLTIAPKQVQLLPAISTLGRDPRMWVITNPSFVLIAKSEESHLTAGDDVEQLNWFNILLDHNQQLQIEPRLAFDHGEVIKSALLSLKRTWGLKKYDGVQTLLGDEFTLNQLKACLGSVDENMLGMNNSNLKRIMTKYIKATDKKAIEGRSRPSRIFKWKY